MFSGLNSEKRNTEYAKNYREISLSHSVIYSSPSPVIPQRSLWFFSVFSVLNSEKYHTENTKNHGARSLSVWEHPEGRVKLGRGPPGPRARDARARHE